MNFNMLLLSTNKYSETKVKNDVERMNSMLNESLRTMGIRYVFTVSDTSDFCIKNAKRRILIK